MTINPWTEIGTAEDLNQQPHVLKFSTLPYVEP